MIDPEEAEHIGDEGAEAGEALTIALLAAIAAELAGVDWTRSTVVRSANVKARIDRVLKKHSANLSDAVRRDVIGAIVLGAIRDVKDASDGIGNAYEVVKVAESSARQMAAKAAADASEAAFMIGERARAEYVKAASRIGVRVRGGEAHRAAMADEIKRLASKGISYTSYVRRDGVTVDVPIDVGLRRNTRSVALDELGKQTIRIAEVSGANYVEVSSHPGARESHAKWQGRVYMLHGSSREYPNYYTACKVGDPVNGIGGYNCNHMRRIFRLGDKRRWAEDPLKGSDCTDEDVRRFRGVQRSIENDIRKLKRQDESLKAAGIDDAGVRKLIRAKQTQLRDHITEHADVLHRERWRESIYEKAIREAKDIARAEALG